MGKVYKAGKAFLDGSGGIITIPKVDKTYLPENFYLYQFYVSLFSQPKKFKSAVVSKKGKAKKKLKYRPWKYTASTVDGDGGTFYYALAHKYDVNLGNIPIISSGLFELSGTGEPGFTSIQRTAEYSILLFNVPTDFYCYGGVGDGIGTTIVEVGWADPAKTDAFNVAVTYIEVAGSRFTGIKML